MPKPTLRKFDEVEPIDFRAPSVPDVPIWVPPIFRGLLWILAIVFFPITIGLIIGYRKGWITWGLGGVVIDPDDEDWYVPELDEVEPRAEVEVP